MTTTLVLGGARSGKSVYAQGRAESAGAPGRPLKIIVTAQVLDDEMGDRVARHRADRDARWTTIEAPLDLSETIALLSADDIAVVDCLTLWLSNVMAGETDVEAACETLVDAVRACQANLLLVSNEVGWGIVPDNAPARRFRDAAGRLHQKLAGVTDETMLVVAGLVLPLSRA